MSTKLFTANVFITKSRQAIQQIFFPGTKITSFTSNLAKLTAGELRNSFISSPSNNEGLLRFEYSFGMNKGNDPTKVLLSFVETSKLLEFVLLDDEPTARKVAHAVDKMAHDSKSKAPPSRTGARRTQPARPSEYGTFSLMEKVSSGGPKDIFASLSNANTYYFAFGVGDDVRNWDGPHIMHLAAATLSNDDSNVRTVDVTFVANIDSLKAWSRNFEKELGYGETLKKFNQIYSARSFHRAEAAVGPLKLPYGLTDDMYLFIEQQSKNAAYYPGATEAWMADETRKIRAQLTAEVGVTHNLDLNLSVRTLIRKYIGAVTEREGNAVVAFPHFMPALAGDLGGHGFAVPTLLLRDYSRKLLSDLGIGYHIVDDATKPTKTPPKIPPKAPLPTYAEAAGLARMFPVTTVPDRRAWREWLHAYETKEERIENLGLRVGTLGDGGLAELPGIFQERLNSARREMAAAGGFPATLGAVNFGSPYGPGEPVRSGSGRGTPGEYFWYPIFEQTYDILITKIPEGMNENGIGNTLEWTAKKNEEFAKSISSGIDALATTPAGFWLKAAAANFMSNYNAVVEQYLVSATEYLPPTIKLTMTTTNSHSQGKVSGFSPLLSPLTKFAAGLLEYPESLQGVRSKEDVKSVVFDFFEETDLRVLSLWEKFGIIKDSQNSAFVFGDVQRIKNALYLDDYMSPKGESHGTNLRIWQTLVNQEGLPEFNEYAKYRSQFAEIFNLKTSSRVSSFEEYDKIPEDSLVMSLAKTQKFDFTKSDLLLKHNIENPNVVSLKYSTKNYITSLHSMQIRPELDKQMIGTTRISAVKEVAETLMGRQEITALLGGIEGETEEEIRVALATDLKSRGMLTEILAKLVNDKKFPELANIRIFDIISLLLVTKKFDDLMGSKSSIVTPFKRFTNVRKDVMDRYVRQLFEVKVKTLPFFNHKLFIGKSCGLLGMTGGVLGGDTDLRHLAPYTGNYTVHGWKHVISFSEVSTTLFLIRSGFDKAGSAGKTTLQYIRENLEVMKAEIESKYKHYSSKGPTREEVRKGLHAERITENFVKNNIEKDQFGVLGALTKGINAVGGLFGAPELIGSGGVKFDDITAEDLESPRERAMRLSPGRDDLELARLQALIDGLPL